MTNTYDNWKLGCGIDDEIYDSEYIDRRAEEMEFMKTCDESWIDWFITECNK